MTGRIFIIVVILSTLFLADSQAIAQAPLNSNVAMQPSKGGFIIRQQFRYTEADRRTLSIDKSLEFSASTTTMVYGMSSELTLILNTPYIFSRRTKDHTTGLVDTDSGFGDIKVLTKMRLYRDDFGPTNTKRFDLIGGLELPTGNKSFTSDSVNPIIGAVFTKIEDRRSFHADALWHFNTGKGGDGVDLFRYDLAFGYRFAPETYASENPTAFFGMIELNGFFETNSDHEIFISPGIVYVTTRWRLEATVHLPIYQELSDRAERDFIIGVGFRIRF